MTAPAALVQKLWNYCSILPPSPRLRGTGRDDGLSYGDYVEQLFQWSTIRTLSGSMSEKEFIQVERIEMRKHGSRAVGLNS